MYQTRWRHNPKNTNIKVPYRYTILGTHLEIYISILVHVECPKYMIAEFLSISAREEHFVHVDKLCWC
jgi:hypothetical protein